MMGPTESGETDRGCTMLRWSDEVQKRSSGGKAGALRGRLLAVQKEGARILMLPRLPWARQIQRSQWDGSVDVR